MKKGYEDTRGWKAYNEELVMRGYFYVNPRFLETWNAEIGAMNAGKVGQPYLYPDSMIRFLAVLHCKSFDYRALEGFMIALSESWKYRFPVIDYSQICRRVNALHVDFSVLEEDTDEYLLVGIDGSGEKVSNRGEWMRQQWKVRRGWIKVVIMGVKGKKGKYVIDIRIGNEKLDERKAARGMIRKNHMNIGILFMDGLHDCRDTFNLCERYDVPTAIKIRENASEKPRHSPRRKEEVKIYKSMPYEEWAREKKYGMRWPLTEGIYSGCKRIFGEHVCATGKKNMYHEVKLKFWAYNQLMVNA